MEKRDSRNYMKKILISFLIAAIFSILSLFCIRIKIQIDYPAMSTGIKLMQNDNSKELNTSRFYGDQVFANATVKDSLQWGQVCIYFICDSGTQISVNNIRVSVGNLVARTYTELDDGYYIGTSDLEILSEEDGEKLLETTGNNPYIMLSHFKRTMAPYILIHTLMVYLITFAVAVAAVLLWNKYKKVIKESARDIWKYIKTNLPKVLSHGVLVVAIMYGCYLILLKYKLVAFSYMSSWEIWYLILGLLLLFFKLKKRTNNWWAIFGCLIVAGLFLFLSIHDITTYMTIDEPRAIEEQSNFQGSNFRHWFLDCAHMNFSIMGTVWKFVPGFLIDNGMIMAEQMAKLLHWLCGVGLLYIIAGRVETYLADREKRYDRAIVYTMILTIMLMIPVVPEALKNYNYDLFSMLLGIWGVIEVCISLQTKRLYNGILGIALLSFGMIEKIIVLPAWLAGMILVIYVMSEELKDKIKNELNRILLLTCLMLGMTVLLICINQVYVFDVLREVSLIYHGISEAVDILLSMPRIGIEGVCKILGLEFNRTVMKMIAAIGYILGITICVKMLSVIKNKLDNGVCAYRVNKILVIIQALFLSIGVGYSVCVPLDNPETYAVSWLNYCGIFVQALPTFALVISILSLIKIFFSKEIEYYLLIQLSASVLMSLVYITTGVESARYSNLFIVLYALASVIILSDYFLTRKKVYCSVAAICSILTLIEVRGSEPAFSYFIPAWNIIPSEVQKRELSAYWGENWVVLADVLQDYCEENDIDPSDVNLHCSYAGYVLENRTGVNMGQYWWRLDGYDNPTENDYFVFETRSIKQGYFEHGIPQNIEPAITVKYHGAITARIYKGTDLIEYFEQYKIADERKISIENKEEE